MEGILGAPAGALAARARGRPPTPNWGPAQCARRARSSFPPRASRVLTFVAAEGPVPGEREERAEATEQQREEGAIAEPHVLRLLGDGCGWGGRMSRALRGGLSLPGPGEEWRRRRRRQGLPVPGRAGGSHRRLRLLLLLLLSLRPPPSCTGRAPPGRRLQRAARLLAAPCAFPRAWSGEGAAGSGREGAEMAPPC